MLKKSGFLALTIVVIIAALVSGYSTIKNIFITEVAVDRIHDFLGELVKFQKENAKISTPFFSTKASITIDKPLIYLNSDTMDALGKKLSTNATSDANMDKLSKLALLNGALVVDTNGIFASEQIFKFSEIKIKANEKAVRLNGKLSIFDANWEVDGELNPDGSFKIVIDTPSMELTKKIYYTLEQEAKKDWDNYLPEGSVAINITVSKIKGRDLDIQAFMKPINLKARYINFRHPAENIMGYVEFRKDNAYINLECSPASPSMQAKAFIRGKAGYRADSAVDVDVIIHGLHLDQKLYDTLPEGVKPIYDELSPRGDVNLKWHITRSEGPNVPYMYDLSIIPQSISIKYKNVPLEISNITGIVHYDYNGFNLKSLTGSYKSATVNLSGFIPSDTTTDNTQLKINASNILIDENLIKALPENVTRIFKDTDISGYADLSCDVVLRPGAESDTDDVTYTTNLHITKSKLKAGVALSDLEGYIMLDGVMSGEKHNVIGSLNIHRVNIADKKFSNVSAEFSYSAGKADIYNLKLFSYGGIIKGSLQIDTNTGEYSGSCKGVGIDLAEYMKDTDMADKKLSGEAGLIFDNIKGKGKDLSTLTADGSISINNGYLWDVPLLVNLLSLNIINTKPLTSCAIEFSIAKETFDVKKLALVGDGTVITGKGTIKFGGELNLGMNVSTTPLSDVPILNLVDKAFDLIKNTIFDIKVKGTFKEPEVRLKVLH